jgi:hypothetical protein
LLLFYAYGLGIGKRSTVATKVIERIEAHYEVQDVEMGKVYRWCPESVVVECECGKKLSLTASKNAYGDCGADHWAIVEEVLQTLHKDDEEEEVIEHPWRSLHPYYAPTRGT